MVLITILYGSQTGNAEDLAKRIGNKAKSLGHEVLVEAADDFNLKLLPAQKLIIFVCSTTGHGQEPENMRKLFRLIRHRDLPKDCLSNLRYAVYGLGDSSYLKFNYIAKILYKRLKDCGAEPIQDLVLGDEQHHLGCDGTIEPGLDELWPKLDMCDDNSSRQYADANKQYSYEVTPNNTLTSPSDVFTKKYYDQFNLRSGICIHNERVTPNSHFQDTRFIKLKSKDTVYQPGDVCAILPTNADEDVDLFIQLLNLDPDLKIKLLKRDESFMVNYLYDFVPAGLNLRDLVKYYMNIQSVPRRSFFEYLWPLSQDELERDKLKEFASLEGQEELYEYCVQPKRSILEVLADFPNTVSQIRLECLFDLVPPIKPRSFSIASSCKLYKDELHLIVGVVNYKTRLRKTRKGLCSNYLASLKPIDPAIDTQPANRLRFLIKQSDFKLPEDEDTPIVMIGPGLGIAPFRSFIQERALLSSDQSKNILYFGCRYEDSDFYFKEELENYANNGLIRLKVAFSREKSKEYVQNMLERDHQLIRELILEQNANIYVAGNSKMPEEIRSIIGTILFYNGDSGEILEDTIRREISRLEAQGRIQYDCW